MFLSLVCPCKYLHLDLCLSPSLTLYGGVPTIRACTLSRHRVKTGEQYKSPYEMSLVSKLRPFEHEVGVSLLNTTLQIIDVEVDIKRYALTDVHKRFQFSRSASGYGS